MQDAGIVGALVLPGLIFLFKNDGPRSGLAAQQTVRYGQANDSTTNDCIRDSHFR